MSETSLDTSLDYLGRFKVRSLQEEYILYCLNQRSKFSFSTIAIMVLTWAIAETIASTWFYDANDNNENTAWDQFYGFLALGLAAIGLVICVILTFSLFNFRNRLIYSYLQVILIVLINLLFALKAAKYVHLGVSSCIPEEYNFVNSIDTLLPATLPTDVRMVIISLVQSIKLPPSCPPADSFQSLVNTFSVFIMSFNYQILTAIIHEPRLYVIWACHIPTTALMLYTIYTSILSLLPVIVGYLTVEILLGELHYQRVQSFLNQRKMQQLLEDNERNADQNHAMEMRHMIGNIAHDLKTPLASFTTGLDMIKDILTAAHRKMRDNPDQQSLTPETFAECFTSIQTCLMNIRNTNTFMLMTINRCLDYTKASKGMKLVPKYETVDLKEAFQFPIDCMSNIQERIGIKVEPMPSEICSHIITDKQWLQENLLCLLSNAVKYSTEGNVTVKAALVKTNDKAPPLTDINLFSKPVTKKVVPTVYEDCDDEVCQSWSLLFEIEDTGIGLSEEASKSLFNPFKQAQRLAGGTGLGLYSLAKRMEALNGSYGVRNRKDGKQGSLFWFKLPYKPDIALSAAARDPAILDPMNKNEPSIRNNGSNSFEVLIVDDSPSILKMSTMMLRRQGHRISTAENGEIALKRIEEKWKESGKGFDIVLMDLQMPVMDGLEATRRLRKMEEEGRDWMITPRIESKEPENRRKPRDSHSRRQVIIGMSANSDHETASDAFAAGVDEFFAKPFSLKTFNKTIEQFFL